MKEIFIGIDLGTTNTLACYLREGKPAIIKIQGKNMLPSVLYVDKDKNIFIGKKAKKWGVLDPKNTIRSSKTYMADAKKTWTVGGMTFTPTEVATEILKEVKAQVIEKLHCAKDTKINAVITVPAYFTGNQKDETKKAGIAAGLNVIRIITEPMAAAVAAVRELGLNEKIFVVDLGGGTFDISVLQADNNIYRAIDLDGDKRLGGDDFDTLLYEYFKKRIQDDLGIDLSSQEKSGLSESDYNSMTGRIREEAEIAKIDLSENTECSIDLPNLFFHDGRNYDFNEELTREDFENICKPLFDKIISRIKNFIAESDKFKVSEIGTVILAGGSCYIPKVKAEVEKIFNKRADSQLNLDTLVVVGAAIVADPTLITGDDFIIDDILSHSLGIEVWEPDSEKLILSKILNKGEKYPCESSKIYTTIVDNQTIVPIYIYEAGSDAENIEDIDAHEYYGDVSLQDIAPAPAGVPNIKVTFRYDISGTVVVEAQDEKSGVKNIVEIKKGDKPPRRKFQRPIDFMLLLDISGSMYDEPLREATQACEILFNDMIDFSVHRMGFITFETYTRRLVPLTQDKNRLKNALRNLSAGGGTNLADALRCADEDLAESSNIKIVIIVTDGQPFDEDFTLDYAERMKKSGIRIITIGAGDEVKESFIQRISSPNDAYKIDNMSELPETFKIALGSIGEKKFF